MQIIKKGTAPEDVKIRTGETVQFQSIQDARAFLEYAIMRNGWIFKQYAIGKNPLISDDCKIQRMSKQ